MNCTYTYSCKEYSIFALQNTPMTELLMIIDLTSNYVPKLQVHNLVFTKFNPLYNNKTLVKAINNLKAIITQLPF